MSDSAKWYVIHTYSGYENAVKTSIEKFVNGRAAGKNIIGTTTISQFVDSLEKPRKVFMMVKAGMDTAELR